MNAIDIEEVRAYWDRRPCNIRHSKEPVGSKEYFDQVEARKYFVEPHIPAFADFRRWQGKRVLELGCGIGTDAVNFARNGADYTGIELSKQSLELARKRFSLYGLTGRFIHANAEDLPACLYSEHFDLVYSFGVIHHTPNPTKAFSNIYKLLPSGSELRLMLYAKNSWKHLMIEAGLDQPEAQAGCPIAKTYTTDEVRSLLSGFSVVEIEQDHIFKFNVGKYINYEYELEPWFESMPKQMLAKLEKSLGWHMLIRCVK